jgi:hypothetical protein
LRELFGINIKTSKTRCDITIHIPQKETNVFFRVMKLCHWNGCARIKKNIYANTKIDVSPEIVEPDTVLRQITKITLAERVSKNRNSAKTKKKGLTGIGIWKSNL